MLGFIAASDPGLRARMFFAPMPEMFDSPESLFGAWRAVGQPAHRAGQIVHLRFGGARAARVLKNARNGVVMADDERRAIFGKTRHPFADGRTLPAAVNRVFVYERDKGRGEIIRFGGLPAPVTMLPDAALTADLALPATADDAFEAVALGAYQPGPWTAGPPAGISRLAKDAGMRTLLLPWNLADPVSCVPDLLLRLYALRNASVPRFRAILLPFNYPGPLGLIRAILRRVKNDAPNAAHVLEDALIARLRGKRGLAALQRLNPVAWVDGHDPEANYTARRLTAANIPVLLIGPDAAEAASTRKRPAPATLACDARIWVETPSLFGTLAVDTPMLSANAISAGIDQSVQLARAQRQAREAV